jgi:hypothetical protein
VYDASGSYGGVMVTAAIVLAAASMTCLALPRPRRPQLAPAV